MRARLNAGAGALTGRMGSGRVSQGAAGRRALALRVEQREEGAGERRPWSARRSNDGTRNSSASILTSLTACTTGCQRTSSTTRVRRPARPLSLSPIDAYGQLRRHQKQRLPRGTVDEPVAPANQRHQSLPARLPLPPLAARQRSPKGGRQRVL